MNTMGASSIDHLSGHPQVEIATPEGTSSIATVSNQEGVDSSSGFKPDISQFSPLVELHVLHRLLESDVTKYQQVAQHIATSLRSAAETMQRNGTTAQVNQLNELAADFTKASQNAELPNVLNLSQTGASGQPLNQYLSGLETTGIPIILHALSNAGVSQPGS